MTSGEKSYIFNDRPDGGSMVPVPSKDTKLRKVMKHNQDISKFWLDNVKARYLNRNGASFLNKRPLFLNFPIRTSTNRPFRTSRNKEKLLFKNNIISFYKIFIKQLECQPSGIGQSWSAPMHQFSNHDNLFPSCDILLLLSNMLL